MFVFQVEHIISDKALDNVSRHEKFENHIGESEKWNNRDIKGAC